MSVAEFKSQARTTATVERPELEPAEPPEARRSSGTIEMGGFEFRLSVGPPGRAAGSAETGSKGGADLVTSVRLEVERLSVTDLKPESEEAKLPRGRAPGDSDTGPSAAVRLCLLAPAVKRSTTPGDPDTGPSVAVTLDVKSAGTDDQASRASIRLEA